MMRILRLALFLSLAFLSAPLCCAQTFQVSGSVVDGNSGLPVGRCQVMIVESHPRSRPKQQTFITSGDGRFQFNNVAEGKYTLVARRNGYRAQPLNEHDGLTSAVVVGPGKESENILFRLQPTASISGRVVDEYGDPVADGQVSLFRRAALLGKKIVYPRGRVNLNQNGVYHFFRLPAGEYYVVVLARPWFARLRQVPDLQNDAQPQPQHPPDEADLDLTFPITYFPGALTDDSSTAITVHAGERFAANMQLSSQPGFHVRNTRPDDPDSTPIEQHLQATVFGIAMNLDPIVIQTISGKVTDFSGVPAGGYKLRERVAGTRAGGPESRKELTVGGSGEVEYGGKTDGTPVTGNIVLEGVNEPMKPMSFEFRRADTAEPLIVHGNANGQLEPFQLFPGVYEYAAFSSQAVIKGLKANGAKVVARTIEIGSGTVELSFEMADVATEIEGTVQGEDGKPLGGALVVIIPEDPEHNQNIFRRDQSDTDGTFKLSVVMPGRYVLVAIRDGWDLEWSNIEAMRRFLAHGQPVQVVPAQDNITTTITAQLAK